MIKVINEKEFNNCGFLEIEFKGEIYKINWSLEGINNKRCIKIDNRNLPFEIEKWLTYEFKVDYVTAEPVRFKRGTYKYTTKTTCNNYTFIIKNILKSKSDKNYRIVVGSLNGGEYKRYNVKISNIFNTGACETIELTNSYFAEVISAKHLIKE